MSDAFLYGAVENLLLRHNKEIARVFRANTDERPEVAIDEVKDLNRYFRVQLGKAPIDTLDERGVLMDDISPKMWLQYFEKHVLPTLVRFNLPSE